MIVHKVDERNEYEEKPALVGETVCDIDESWANHPYYEDLDKHETVQNGELDQDDDIDDDDDIQQADPSGCEAIDVDVPWADHAFYDTQEGEDVSHAESDDPGEDGARQDNSNNEEEDELAWEDSPYQCNTCS